MSGETVSSLSAAVRVQDPLRVPTTNETFSIRLKKSPPDPTEIADQIVKQIGFTAPDIET